MLQAQGFRSRPGTPRPPVRSIRPFKSCEQYLEAMKEDLAEWLRDLYGLDIDKANFLQVLETGLVLCRHANAVTEAALAFLEEAPSQAQTIPMPRAGVSCNGAAQPGTFQARDNVSNFIQWCRKEMGIQEVLMFETEDLVLRKNVRNVVLCLLELGRRAWRFGVAAPTLVQLEEEIDQELRRELALPPPDPPPRPPARHARHFHNLDQMVRSLVSHCTCPVQFSMVKVSEGKYRVGDSNTLIFIRILRNHVMVRVGGGWDTLGHYLDKHDPCRCTSLTHKPGSFLKPPAPPVQHEVRVQDGPSQPQPTMTVSRSQTPLPPVDWKTYTSPGRKLRPPTSFSSSPRSDRGAGMGVVREMTAPLRCRERSLTPSRRQRAAGDSPFGPHSSTTHRGGDPQGTPAGVQKDRQPPELLRGRTPTSWVHEETDSWGRHGRAPTPQGLRASKMTTRGTPARGTLPLPHSSSRVKTLNPKQHPWGEAEGASLQFRESDTIHSPSSVRGSTKIPTQLTPTHPHTPGRSSPSLANGAPNTEQERSPHALWAVAEDPAGSRPGDHHGKGRQADQTPDIWVTGDAGKPPGPGPQEQERRDTHNSLEEEILANRKLLEVRGACPRGTGSGIIPRSGVYVPSLGGRWPEPGGTYEKVIQELAQGPPPLFKVDLGAWQTVPTGSPKSAVTLNPGRTKGKLGIREDGPRTGSTLSVKDPKMGKGPLQQAKDSSAPSASVIPEVTTLLPSDPNPDKVNACTNKGKRTLRKPQRIPSIYKLKLRPRIRPRRDHRPENQPSRIPRPLAYLCLAPIRTSPRQRLMGTALGSKEGEASPVNKALKEGREDEGQDTTLQSSLPPSEDQRPQERNQSPRTPEESSWV
ncbi:PREDICTED: GAS2-like protein 2 [Elephantulus edwardii]|uniref:GAS2-like protein 2 n=1 Tax=Elephantulus edwardii TaxID=28737 RepID=UPI0003F0B5A0|nr:PREDICTED: GAS2-like protein 2 [Elephantulus edwardii]